MKVHVPQFQRVPKHFSQISENYVNIGHFHLVALFVVVVLALLSLSSEVNGT